MEQGTSEPVAGAWFLAGVHEPKQDQPGVDQPGIDQHCIDQHCIDQHGGDPPEPAEGVMIQDVIISVSLDELDGLSGDMLV